MTAADTWEPGIPLYSSQSTYRSYFFNFRDEEDPHAEPGTDAARWPDPIGGRGLPYRDELEEFIAGWHAWRRHLLNMEGA